MDIVRLDIGKAEPDAPTEGEVRFQVAALAAIVATAASLVARFGFDAPLIPELLAHVIFAVVPIWLVEIAVGMLGPFAKHLAFLGCVVLYLLALVAAAQIILKAATGKMKAVLPVAFALAVWAITMTAIIPLLGGGLGGRYLRQGALYSCASLLAVHLVYGAATAFFSRLYLDSPARALSGGARLSRRRLLRGVGYAVAAVALVDMTRSIWQSWLQAGSGRVSGGDGIFPNINGLALEITPTPDFYTVSKNPFDPEVDAARWRLQVGGMVENPLSLTYEDFKSLPAVEQYATLECIDNKVGGNLIGNALWRGARLKDLLDRAGLQPGVVDIVFRASDDYRDSIPLARAMAEGTILAYEMNGAPLTPAHGFPLRLIVPGIYGMKNIKWITKIEAVNYDFKGYWQARGWDDRAEYKTMSRIDAPDGKAQGGATIAGIAFAGDRGISKVEVSTDGGKTWEQAEVKPPLSPYSWALWHKEWTPSQPGEHALVVRATDGLGITQTADRSPAAPDGVSGHHRIKVESK